MSNMIQIGDQMFFHPGYYLQEWLEEKNMSVEEFADKTNISLERKIRNSSKVKVIFAFVISVVGLFTMGGCKPKSRVKIVTADWKESLLTIDVGFDYIFNTYDRMETDSGCSITIYFDKEETEEK